MKSSCQLRLSLFKVSKSTSIYLNGDIGLKLMIMSKRFVRYQIQMNEVHVRAFTLLLLGWKKVMKKTHDSWINSYSSAPERSISMRFSTFRSSSFYYSQNYNIFAIPMMKIRIEIFEFKKFHFSKWLNPQLKMLVLKSGTVKIGQKCVNSLSKRLIYVSFIEIQVQVGLFLEISEAGTYCLSKMRYNEAQHSTTTIKK